MKKLMAMILSLVIVFSVVSAMADTLTMGTHAEFAPYEFIEGDVVVGIDAEIAAAAAAKMGYDLEIVDMDFGALPSAVASGKIDFAMAGMTVTEDRLKTVNFSVSYATGVQVIIVTEDSPIQSIEDLKAEGTNPKFGVQMSTTGDYYATWDFEDEGLGTVERFPSGNEAVLALKTGKVDCVMIDNEPAKSFVAENEGLKILESPYTLEDYAAAFSKDKPELLEAFNAALTEMIEDGTVAAIVAKYIPESEN